MNKRDDLATEIEGVCPRHGQQIITAAADLSITFECGCSWRQRIMMKDWAVMKKTQLKEE